MPSENPVVLHIGQERESFANWLSMSQLGNASLISCCSADHAIQLTPKKLSSISILFCCSASINAEELIKLRERIWLVKGAPVFIVVAANGGYFSDIVRDCVPHIHHIVTVPLDKMQKDKFIEKFNTYRVKLKIVLKKSHRNLAKFLEVKERYIELKRINNVDDNEVNILVFLMHEEPLGRPVDLSTIHNFLNIPLATAHRKVLSLEKKGYLKKLKDENDHRRLIIKITEDAELVIGKLSLISR